MMYSKGLFGSYYPVASKVHNMSVIVKLLNFFLFVLVMIGSSGLELHLFVLAVIVLQAYESKVPFRFYFNMFYSLRYVYVFLIFVFASSGLSLELSLVILLKFVLVIEYLALLVFTTSMSEFDYGIYKVLNPINFLNLNVSYISLVIGNVFRFVPNLISTEYRVLRSQAGRGVDYFYSGIVGKTFAVLNSLTNSFRLTVKRMAEINRLSKLRMFSVKRRKTNLRTGKFSFYAFMLLLFHVLFLVGYMLEVKII